MPTHQRCRLKSNRSIASLILVTMRVTISSSCGLNALLLYDWPLMVFCGIMSPNSYRGSLLNSCLRWSAKIACSKVSLTF